MRSSRLGEVFEKAVAATAAGVTLANAREPDMPLIFVNQAFCKITGYSAEEVLGRNCRFLQGDGTDRDGVQAIRENLKAKQSCVVELLNYTKAGKAFWNRLSLVPLSDDAGELTYVVGLQADITETKEAEAERHRLYGMTTTMHTVNDIVLNFMNNLQLYRIHMEETWNVDRAILQEFDTIFNDAVKKLSKINSLTKFKSKTGVPGISMLDTE